MNKNDLTNKLDHGVKSSFMSPPIRSHSENEKFKQQFLSSNNNQHDKNAFLVQQKQHLNLNQQVIRKGSSICIDGAQQYWENKAIREAAKQRHETYELHGVECPALSRDSSRHQSSETRIIDNDESEIRKAKILADKNLRKEQEELERRRQLDAAREEQREANRQFRKQKGISFDVSFDDESTPRKSEKMIESNDLTPPRLRQNEKVPIYSAKSNNVYYASLKSSNEEYNESKALNEEKSLDPSEIEVGKKLQAREQLEYNTKNKRYEMLLKLREKCSKHQRSNRSISNRLVAIPEDESIKEMAQLKIYSMRDASDNENKDSSNEKIEEAKDTEDLIANSIDQLLVNSESIHEEKNSEVSSDQGKHCELEYFQVNLMKALL